MSVQVCFSSGASVNGPRFSVARYSLILSRQAWRQLSLKKLFVAAEDDGAFADELAGVLTEEELAGFAEELLAVFTEEELATFAEELSIFTEELLTTFTEELLATFAEEEEARTAADELAGDFAEDELATFVEELLTTFADEEDKYLPGACTEEELVKTM